MWLKPPEWPTHYCDSPNVWGREYMLGSIWRCDDCLKVYICVRFGNVIQWKSYRIGDGV